MRFNKKNRKLGRKKSRKGALGGLSFWLMLAGGLALMAGFLVLMYAGQARRLRGVQQDKIASDMDRICVALILFYQDHGHFPSDRDGLGALVSKDAPGEDRGGVSGPGALSELPQDPWRNPYRYQAPQGNASLRLTCLGADGATGGTGDAADVVRQGCRSAALSGN